MQNGEQSTLEESFVFGPGEEVLLSKVSRELVTDLQPGTMEVSLLRTGCLAEQFATIEVTVAGDKFLPCPATLRNKRLPLDLPPSP